MNIITKTTVLALALSAAVQAQAIVTDNGTLQLGVNAGGQLIDYTTFVGLRYDPTGSGQYGTADVLVPGTPFAFYGLGAHGRSSVAGGYGQGNNPFSATTSLLGDGAIGTQGSYAGLSFEQTLRLDGSRILATVTLRNDTAETLDDVVYSVGFDPDQDAFVTGSHYTDNEVLKGISDAQGGAAVEATGSGTGITVALRDLTADTTFATYAQISQDWTADPYELLWTNGTGTVEGWDATISLGYDIGSLASGQTVTLSYEYALAPVPEPETYALMGAGLMGVLVARRRQLARRG